MEIEVYGTELKAKRAAYRDMFDLHLFLQIFCAITTPCLKIVTLTYLNSSTVTVIYLQTIDSLLRSYFTQTRIFFSILHLYASAAFLVISNVRS